MTTGQIFLRNRHPIRPLVVPLGNGWSRIVPPQSCTAVSSRVLHLPPVAAGLAAEQLAVVTEVNAGADARAFATLRRDLTIAIARAEQRTFDRLLHGLPTYRKPRAEDRTNAPYTLLKAAAAKAGMPLATLRAALNGELALPASLKCLVSHKAAAGSERKTRTALDSVHWRRRNDLAAALFAAVQRKRRLTDPATAAEWLIGELASDRARG